MVSMTCRCASIKMTIGGTSMNTAAAIATRLTSKSGSVMGLIYVASGFGGALAGSVIGQVSDSYGISTGFNFIIAFVAVFFILAMLIKEKTQ